MFRATMCPIIRETYCIYATLIFFVLYGWLSGLQCRIDTVSSPDDGAHSCPKHVEKMK